MAVQITNTSEAVFTQGVKMLVWAESGNGKTTFAGSAPEGCTAIIDLEGGLLSIRNKNHVVFRCHTYADVLESYKLIQTPQYGHIQVVVLDSITELGEKVLVEAQKNSKDGRAAYMAMGQLCLTIVKAFRDLPQKHVVMTCKSDIIKDDSTGMLIHGPAMPGQKLGPQLPYLFDEVFYLGVHTAPPTQAGALPTRTRYVQTDADAQRRAKDRSCALAFYEPADLTHILTKILTPQKAS